jgi:hypothetical protein
MAAPAGTFLAPRGFADMLRKRSAMPTLIQFLLTEFANGVVVGLTFALALLWCDVGSLGALLRDSPSSAALTALFFGQAALLFGTLGMSVAVMTLPKKDR